MPVEIERKFLLSNQSWRESVLESVAMSQGYLSTDPDRTVRVRQQSSEAFLTIKGKTSGITRVEIELPIPAECAGELLAMCPNLVVKTRHLVCHGTHTWEVDEFHGLNDGLIIAELELSSEDEPFDLPDWAGREVSGDHRYSNSSLSTSPFTSWVQAG